MITDKSSNEDLKEKLTQQQIKQVEISNMKKKGTPKLDTALKVGKGLVRVVEKM